MFRSGCFRESEPRTLYLVCSGAAASGNQNLELRTWVCSGAAASGNQNLELCTWSVQERLLQGIRTITAPHQLHQVSTLESLMLDKTMFTKL
jgi:hypothetical protein